MNDQNPREDVYEEPPPDPYDPLWDADLPDGFMRGVKEIEINRRGYRGQRYQVEFVARLLDGRPELVHLRVSSPFWGARDRDPLPIPGELLKQLAPQQLAQDAREQTIWEQEALQWRMNKPPVRERATRLRGDDASPHGREQLLQPRRGSRATWDLTRLREVADTYLASVTAGSSPRQAIAERFHVTVSFADKLIARCRDAELLERTSPGKPSRRPGGQTR